MSPQKPILHQVDIDLLKKTFATKDDLKVLKSDIRNLDSRFTSVGSDINIMDLRLRGIEKPTKATNLRLLAVEDSIKTIEKILKTVAKNINKINKNINMIIDHFDIETIDHKKRLERIETHLHLSSLAD